jgi:hypothetical protein
MSLADRTTELDPAQGQRKRHGGQSNQHQHPEGVHLGQKRSLGLYLRTDPLHRLVMGLRECVAAAEVNRFPELASTVSRSAQRLSTEVAALHLGEIARSGDVGRLPAFAPERISVTSRVFKILSCCLCSCGGCLKRKSGASLTRWASKSHAASHSFSRHAGPAPDCSKAIRQPLSERELMRAD